MGYNFSKTSTKQSMWKGYKYYILLFKIQLTSIVHGNDSLMGKKSFRAIELKSVGCYIS